MEFFVHITGSVRRTSGPDAIALTQRTAYETARALLREKIGVVALVSGSSNKETVAFDDEIIKAAADHLKETDEVGILLQGVMHQTKRTYHISDDIRENLRLLSTHAHLESIPADEHIGRNIRNKQADLSDGAIVIGGYQGVFDTVKLLIYSCSPKPVDEIFVKGIDGGLPADMREVIDETRGWDSKADLRTVHEENDCARVAHSVASSLALCLRKQNDSAIIKTRRKPSVWDRLKSPQLPSWISVVIHFVKFWGE